MNKKVFSRMGGARIAFCCKNALLILTMVLFSFEAFSQTITFPNSCTSKDLSLVSATLTGGDLCNSCVEGSTQTRNLVLGINNKTGSTRTSFAFWATLTVTHSDGSTTVSEIHRCAGPIPPTGPLPAFYSGANFGTITYQCGDSLVLTNLHLAWTDASPNSTCATINPATINPKCGTLPMIRINAGVNGSISVTDESCTSGGRIEVIPFGGRAPYSILVNGITNSNVASGATSTFNNLPGGTYPVKITDANACEITFTKTVDAAPGIPVPLSTQVQTTCLNATGSCTITSPVAGYVYTLRQSNAVIYTAVNGVFPAVAPGTYQLVAVSGSCSNNGANVEIDPQPGTPAAPTVCIVEPSLCGPSTGSVTILSPSGAGYQYSINNGSTWQSSMVFNNVAAGSVTGIRTKSPSGCISDPATCADSNCEASKVASSDVKPEEVPAVVTEEKAMPLSDPAPQITNTDTVDFDVSPVPFSDRLTVKYNFDYQSYLTIEVIDSSGRLILSKTEFKDANRRDITIDLKSKIEKSQLYFVKLTTNRGSATKSLLSSN